MVLLQFYARLREGNVNEQKEAFQLRFIDITSHVRSPESDRQLTAQIFSTMSTAQQGSYSRREYVDPTPMPSDIPHVDEVGATSAPLKSAAFFIGAYCKEYNGSFFRMQLYEDLSLIKLEDFILCKNESRDPGHCLKEGRRVTRCTTDLCVFLLLLFRILFFLFLLI